MRKLLSLALGLAVGAAVAGTLVVLFTPASGDDVKHNLKRGWDETMDEAHRASEERRLQLESELARKRGQTKMILP
jgi:hypothetical protein